MNARNPTNIQGGIRELDKEGRNKTKTYTVVQEKKKRRHLALGTLIWGFASSSSSSVVPWSSQSNTNTSSRTGLAALALESECASCSDSNSSLQPGDKAFRVSNTGLRVLDVKEGKGDQASRGQVGARTRVLSSCTSECGAH